MKYFTQTKLGCFICAGLVFAGCGSKTQTEATPAKMVCHVETQALDIRDNGKGRDLAESILLADIKRTPTMIAYGPALNPKAEITVLDGKYYLTEPDGVNTKTSHTPAEGQAATFMVSASAGAWMDGAVMLEAKDLQDISSAISRYAVANGCDGNAVFPYKIKAHAKHMTWSISGSPKSMKGTLNDVDIIIVGLFDNSGKPRNAIMSGLDIHPHFVIPSLNMSGHLNAVELAPGAILYVPQETHIQ